jgi:hypothetical protein
VFLSTGAALVVYVVAGISLVAALALILTMAVVLGSYVLRRADTKQKKELPKLVKVGFIAGFLATGAYDLSRFFLIEVTGIRFWPFDIFTIFGQSLLGAGYEGSWVRLLGLLFHFTNGIGFAIAYTISFGRRGIGAGIVWAMVLELCMVTIYPGWLEMKALDEFLQVSILGHIVYGVMLGYVSKWLLSLKTGKFSY